MNYLELPGKEYGCNFELQINEIFSLNQGNTAVVRAGPFFTVLVTAVFVWVEKVYRAGKIGSH